MLKLRMGQAGDTIVEVIIVLAVLGLAISISYATASRSLEATRQAEENSQATAILQSQIETLRAFVALTDAAHNIFQSSAYCIDSSGTVTTNTTMTSADVTSGATSTYSQYAGGCVYKSLYHIAIGYDSGSDVFTARATWDDVSGKGIDTATLVYRLHKP